MQKEIEKALGRKLTDEEKSLVNWINRWNEETVDAFRSLLTSMWQAGQADAEAHHEAMERGTARD